MTEADFLSRLSNVSRNGNGHAARCPGHDDHHNSASVTTGDDGRILVYCHAGCTVEQIVSALGLTLRDLFPTNGNGITEEGLSTPPINRSTHQQSLGCTVEQLATAKQLPIEFLKSQGLTDCKYQGNPAVRTPYLDRDGQESAVQYRKKLYKDSTDDDRFCWKKDAKPCLYGLSRLNPKPDCITLVEGASDCLTLWFHNIPAIGLPSATGWKEDRDAVHFDGIDTIYVNIEPDTGGETVKRWLSKSQIRSRVRLVSLGEYKDPSGLYLADPAHFLERWNAALAASVPWTEHAAAEAAIQCAAAWELCKELAQQPRILDCFAQDIARCGLAGEQRTAKRLHLGVTSRFLQRPVSQAVKGPSSGGKSFLVESVLKFHPESAYYALSAMSEHALAYSEEPLQHRFLVIYEAAGMESDLATYLIRSLLSEGCVRYETVEKTADGLQAKLIEREGPTGLLVTTTATKLHPENETRLLSSTVSDTPEQTHDVLLALAEENAPAIDYTRWHALQTWLEGGAHRVVIPYAKALAEKIPPVAVRLRRDFGAVLNFIRAHAILHQATRQKDNQGRIVATLDDYAVVRELVHDLVSEGVEATVSATIRETVEAVRKCRPLNDDPGTSVSELARMLNIDKAAASRRAKAAIDRSLLKNLETRRGKPARLLLGDPLPEEQPILPPPEEVLTCCSVDEGDKSPSSSCSPEGEEPGTGYCDAEGFDWQSGQQIDVEVL